MQEGLENRDVIKDSVDTIEGLTNRFSSLREKLIQIDRAKGDLASKIKAFIIEHRNNYTENYDEFAKNMPIINAINSFIGNTDTGKDPDIISDLLIRKFDEKILYDFGINDPAKVVTDEIAKVTKIREGELTDIDIIDPEWIDHKLDQIIDFYSKLIEAILKDPSNTTSIETLYRDTTQTPTSNFFEVDKTIKFDKVFLNEVKTKGYRAVRG